MAFFVLWAASRDDCPGLLSDASWWRKISPAQSIRTEEIHGLYPRATGRRYSQDAEGGCRLGRQAGGVRSRVESCCSTRSSSRTHLTPEQCRPRKVLYEDPELGFCICGHVYENDANGAPHDHGNSWAIYGVAKGDTEMTDWRIVKKAEGDDAEPGRTGPHLRDEARRLHGLRRRRRAFAKARRPDQAGAHRGQESRPRAALEHQGGVRRVNNRVIASAAKHRLPARLRAQLDCFVASLLAMTANRNSLCPNPSNPSPPVN